MLNCVTIERKGLQCYVRSTRERLLKMGQGYMRDKDLGQKEYTMAKAEERRQDWENKPLHGRFLRSTDELASSRTWNWLRTEDLKTTEGPVVAMQDQSLRTNEWRVRIEEANISPMSRMCGVAEETVFHLVTECSVMAQNEYKGRHNKVAKIILGIRVRRRVWR